MSSDCTFLSKSFGEPNPVFLRTMTTWGDAVGSSISSKKYGRSADPERFGDEGPVTLIWIQLPVLDLLQSHIESWNARYVIPSVLQGDVGCSE